MGIHGWGRFDKGDPSTLHTRMGGYIGTFMYPGKTTPSYTPACVHYFPHLGYVGFCWGLRWTELADFMLGWTTIDIAGDDGFDMPKWSWPKRQGRAVRRI